MATDTAYRIAALRPETWAAFDAMVLRHNGIFGGCWCTWFHDGHPSCAGRGETAEGNRAIKKRLVDEGVARAALVMAGDEAIAWAEFGTPAELPTLHHRKEYDATTTVVPDWRITCVFVDKRYRRQGGDGAGDHGRVGADRAGWWRARRELSARPHRPDQEDVVVVPLQRDASPL